MSQKTYEKLIHVNYSANNPVTPRMVTADFVEHQSPASRLHHLALHGWGVASGLEVRASADSTSLQVENGVAISPAGQLIVLSTNGAGLRGDAPPLTEAPTPVVIPPESLAPLAGRKVAITIQFQDTLRQVPVPPGGTNEFPGGKLEQTPWVRVQEAAAFAPGPDQVVIALADVDGAGKVTGVVSDAPGVAPARQRLRSAVGEVQIERPARDGAVDTTVGVLKPLQDVSGVQVVTDTMSVTGKLGIGQPTAARPLDVVGGLAVRQAADGRELVVASVTPGGGGAVETRDAAGKRLTALTTTGSDAQQAGYIAVGTATGTESVSLSAAPSGAGQVHVQTRAGQAAVVLETTGDADDGILHILANNQDVVTLGPSGVVSKGDIISQSNLTAQGNITSKGNVTASGALFADGGAVGKAGLWTDGNVQAQGAVFATGNVLTNGVLFADGGVVGKAGLWTDGSVQAQGAVFATGNVQTSGVLFADGGAVAKAGLWTDGHVQCRGALIADGGAVGKAGLWSDGNVQCKGTVFADGNVQCKGALFANGGVVGTAGVWTDGQVVAKGDIFGRAKHFVMNHPNDEKMDIVYGSIEGPEAAAYIRGRAALQGGKAIVELPEHFLLVINEATMTIQLTARSAGSKGLAVVESEPGRFAVRELLEGTGSYDFDYFVSGVRKGYEDYQPVVSKGASPLAQRLAVPSPVDTAPGVSPSAAAPTSIPTTVDSPSRKQFPASQPTGGAGSGKARPWSLL